MRTPYLLCLISGLFLTAGPLRLAAQPVVTGVSNSASYQTGIAQGSIFVLFGSNLGPASLTQASSLPLGTSLAGTSVTFTPVSGGSAVSALMVYTVAGQVSGILPSSAPVGDHNVTVTYNGQTSAQFRTQVVARNFGMYTLTSTGTGPVVAQNFVSGSELPVNQLTAPARPGQVIILYGTGLGPIGVSDANVPGAQDFRAQTNIRVLVGGVEINPDYAGRSPASPGLDQINFTLPGDIVNGCVVPIQVRVGTTTTTKPVSLAIAPGGAEICSYPGVDPAAIRRLANRETLTFGAFDLSVSSFSANVPGLGAFDFASESAGGSFNRVSLANITEFGGLDAYITTIQNGACFVTKIRTNGLSLDVIEEAQIINLNAGPALTLNGPGVSNRSMPRQAQSGDYYLELRAATPPLPGQPPAQPVIQAGEYTITGPGGPDVGSFTARTRVPTPLNWTNRGSINSINRSQPLTLNWTGGGSETVSVYGSASTRIGTGDNAPYETTFFLCNQRASAGTFTVPTSVLQQLPAVSSDFLSQRAIGLLGLFVEPSDRTAARFNAPLTAGGNVDFAYFVYSQSFSKVLDIQ